MSDDWLQHGHDVDGIELTPVLSSSGGLDGRGDVPSTPRWTSGWRGLAVGGSVALVATLGLVGVANAIGDNLFPSMGSARPSSVWLNPVPPTTPEPTADLAPTTTSTSTTSTAAAVPTTTPTTVPSTSPATSPSTSRVTVPSTGVTATSPTTSPPERDDDDDDVVAVTTAPAQADDSGADDSGSDSDDSDSNSGSGSSGSGSSGLDDSPDSDDD